MDSDDIKSNLKSYYQALEPEVMQLIPEVKREMLSVEKDDNKEFDSKVVNEWSLETMKNINW